MTQFRLNFSILMKRLTHYFYKIYVYKKLIYKHLVKININSIIKQ